MNPPNKGTDTKRERRKGFSQGEKEREGPELRLLKADVRQNGQKKKAAGGVCPQLSKILRVYENTGPLI